MKIFFLKFLYIFILFFDLNERIVSRNSDYPTVVVLLDDRLTLVDGHQSWDYVIESDSIRKPSKNGPKPVDKTRDNLPDSLSGALEVEEGKYYLFRGNRYCVRNIESDSSVGTSLVEEEESIEVYQLDRSGHKKKVSINNAPDDIDTIVDGKSKCVWKSNRRLFTCILNKDKPGYKDLCSDPTITGVIGYKNHIYVLTPNKVHKFDGQFTAIHPLGQLIPPEFKLNAIWSDFDPKKEYGVNGKVAKKDQMIQELDKNVNAFGAPVVLPNERIAVVAGHQVFYFKTIEDNVFKEREANQLSVDKTYEHFPPSLSGAMTLDQNNYYFFKGIKYCVRKLNLELKASGAKQSHHSETHRIDSKGQSQLVHSEGSEITGYKSIIEDRRQSSGCIWKDNNQLFGCQSKGLDKNMKKFCKNPIINCITVEDNEIHVITSEDTLVFDAKSDQPFSKLKTRTPQKYEGLNPSENGCIFVGKTFCVINTKDTTIKCWKSDGSFINSETIYTKQKYDKIMAQRMRTTTQKSIVEYADEPDGNVDDGGALIPKDDGSDCEFTLIQKNIILDIIRENDIFWIKEKRKVSVEMDGQLIAAIHTSNNKWYFINNEGKYCKSSDTKYSECNDWQSNRHLFGCKQNQLRPELKAICDNPRISSGGNYGPNIYVFRNGKHWMFDNKMGSSDPFGQLVESGVPAKQKWPKIALPGAVGTCHENFVVFHKNYWSEWSPKGLSIVVLKELQEKEIEYPDEKEGMDRDGGALILISERKYAKLNKDKVCYVLINEYKAYWVMSCVSVAKDVMNFPKDIVAAIKPEDNNWYFITKSGKYCKREQKSSKPCKQWKDSKELFGCNKLKDSDSDDNRKALEELCKKPLITSGTSCAPFVYVFRGGKYWQFNSKSKAGKPFGDLIHGNRPAKHKWPNIHFPAGMTCDKYGFVTTYATKWSRWALAEDNEVQPSSRGTVSLARNLVLEHEILHEEPDDELEVMIKSRTTTKKPPSGEGGEGGGLISGDDCTYTKVSGELVCRYVIKDKKFSKNGKCVGVDEDVNKFPPNVVAIIRSSDKGLYFFNKEGKYCHRAEGVHEECIQWLDNKQVFGCEDRKSEPMLRSLCANTHINAGGNLPNHILVFRGGKYWQFDGIALEGKPFGKVITGGAYAKDKWPGIKFPGGAGYCGKDFVMIYSKQWLRWKADEKVANVDLIAETKSCGTAVVLPNHNIAVVKDNQAWYYKKIGDKIVKSSKKFKPKRLNETIEMFPNLIDSAFSFNKKVYYFFRGSQYCKRPLIVDEDTDLSYGDWIQSFEVTEKSYNIPLSPKEKSKHFRLSKDLSHCIWRSNAELIGCESSQTRKEFPELCANPITIGTVIYDKSDLYFFTKDKIYIMNGRSIGDHKSGDKLFQNIRPVVVIPAKKWSGFDLTKYCHFFADENSVCVIIDNKRYKCWDPKGRPGDELPIGEAIEEPKDRSSKGNTTVLIPEGTGDGYYFLIYNKKTIRISIDCESVEELPAPKKLPKFPDNLIAVIKSKDSMFYMIRNDGKYCKKSDLKKPECKDWKKVKTLYGCDAKTVTPDLSSLCSKPAIDSAGVYNNNIHVFRGGKYWVFDNRPKKAKPFGDLIEGPKLAEENWKGIQLPGAIVQSCDNFMVINGNKWTEWKTAVIEIFITKIIIVRKVEAPDEKNYKDEDSGALIQIDESKGRFAKIKGKKVCYLKMKKECLFWDGECVSVKKDSMAFPANIVAAIRSKDDFWYYFDKSGKYCKRADNQYNKCNKWSKNAEVFGCSEGKGKEQKKDTKKSKQGSDSSQELEFLCKNPKIIAGGNGPMDQIFVFRGGKYWHFDNIPKPDKPFGELISGSKPAKDKWPGIHFAGGVSHYKNNLIIVYNNHWFAWSQTDVKKGAKKGVKTIDRDINREDPPDVEIGPWSDGGALINPDKSEPKYRKIRGEKVCRFVLKKNIVLSSGNCLAVTEDKNKYPPNIVAAIKTSDNNWYFIDKNGKYCKRSDNNTKECSKWKENRELFGCTSGDINCQLECLCDNHTIDSGANHGKSILVFRGGKYWEFNNKPTKVKPFGDLVAGCLPAKHRWPGIHFPGGFGQNGKNFLAIYDRKWSQWAPAGDAEVDNRAIEDEERCPPTAVVLQNNRIAIVDKDIVRYYKSRGKETKITKDSSFEESLKVEFSAENFPKNLCAAVTTNQLIYYFFRGDRYCKRPIKIDQGVIRMNSIEGSGIEGDNDVYESDWYGPNVGSKTRKLPEEEAKKYFSKSEESNCIWRETTELFGCDDPKRKKSKEWTELCANPRVTAATVSENQFIHIIIKKKVYVIDVQPKGDVNQSRDQSFTNLDTMIVIDVKKKWKGFDPNNGQFFAVGDKFCVMTKKSYQCWKGDKLVVINKTISSSAEEPKDEPPSGDPSDAGAVLNVDPQNGIYHVIRGKEKCVLVMEDKLYQDGQCVPVAEDPDNYPPDIIAAIKNRDNVWHFINVKGRYCQRPTNSREQCKEWADNREVFGCDASPTNSPELDSLCNDPVINAGGNYPPEIYVFRGGKLWQFDNKPQPLKPFGNLLDGAIAAKTTWPGIKFPGAFGNYLENTIMIYRKKWSLWKPDGKQEVVEQPIEQKVVEIPDEPESDPEDSGALILVDESIPRYAKILGKKVCYVKVKDSRMFWSGKCVKVAEDENNFPPDIIAAIKAKDNKWYFISRDGEYCTRSDGNVEKCTKWDPNEEIFGCKEQKKDSKGKGSSGRTAHELAFLCKDTKINAGGNYPPFIYVFRGGKYWMFDNKPEKGKPFGNLVEGQVVAKDKWPGIHFPGGVSYLKDDFIIVYKNRWSRWTPKGERVDNRNVETTTEVSDDEEVFSKGGKRKEPLRNIIKNEPIETDEIPDEADGDPSDVGALFNDDPKPNVKTHVRGDLVCNLLFRKDKLYRIGDCLTVDDDKHQYPPDLVAAIFTRDKLWYFVNNEGKFCRRKDKLYERCKEWTDNEELFGCNAKNKNYNLDELCQKPKINAGGNYPPHIYVFRGGKYWAFDNKPEKQKPLGNLVEAAKPAKQRWPGIRFPGAFGNNDIKPIMVYNNTWSQWLPNGDPEVKEAPILDLDNSPGAAVVLPNSRVAVVVKDQVWYYRTKGPKVYYDSEDTDAMDVSKSLENFPSHLSAALTINLNIYYFFKDNKYCKRPLIVDEDSHQRIQQTDWDNMPALTDDSEPDMIAEEEASKYFTLDSKDSNCIWRDNRELLGCKSSKVYTKISRLCVNPITIGSIIYDNHLIYVFTHVNLYVFDPRGKAKKNMDPAFTKLVSDNVEPSVKWKGFDPNYGRFFATSGNQLCVIIDNVRYSCWSPNGDKFIDNHPIEFPEHDVPDEEQEDNGDGGALINPEDNNGKYARIKGHKVCELAIEDEDLYFVGECLDVKSEPHKYPPDIIAAIKAKDNNWYFFDKEGKYCKRSLNSYKECTEWRDNKEPFGCTVKQQTPELQHLCKNVEINAGGNYPPNIYVFRGGKLWVFNNKPKPKKPFGELIELLIPAKARYPGLHTPGAVGHNADKFMIVYSKKWSQWLPKGINDLLDEPILVKTDELPDQPEHDPEDAGALIPTNETAKEYAKILKDRVCYVVVKKNKMFWKGKCRFVSVDKNNFPPDIVAAIQAKDKNWFFFDRNGQHCKRADKSVEECKKWTDNKKIFGCDVSKPKPELKFLCQNTRINAGGNYPPNILVFRGGKYWKFDNQPKPNLPFGNLVEGQVPARIQWPGIYFPGGVSYQKPNKLIIVYKRKWSRWGPTAPDPSVPSEEGSNDGPDKEKDDKSKSDPKRGKGDEDDESEVKPSKGEKKPKGGKGEIDDESEIKSSKGIKKPKGRKGEEDDESDSEPSKGDNKQGKGDDDDDDKKRQAMKSFRTKAKNKNKGLKPSDDNDVNDDEIRDPSEDTLEELNGPDSDAGALIPIDEMNSRFAKIVENKVCYLVVRPTKAFWSGECIAVTEDDNNFPPYIVAAIKNDDNDWFFFDKSGKYCKRRKNNFQTCTEWRDNSEVFGCSRGSSRALTSLCSNLIIKAGTQEALSKTSGIPRIWVFRGGKFWVFDNKVSDRKPFGDVIEGEKLANDLWNGIHFPGGSGFDGNNFIMVYKKKWSRWTPQDANHTLEGDMTGDHDWLLVYKKKNRPVKEEDGNGAEDEDNSTTEESKGKDKSDDKKKSDDEEEVQSKKGKAKSDAPNDGDEDEDPKKKVKDLSGDPSASGDGVDFQRPIDVFEEPIGDEDHDMPKIKVGTDGDSALIPIDKQKRKYSKVIGDQICHYSLRDKDCYKLGNCTHVSEDVNRNNFPPFLVGAILAGDSNWYFINRDGQYCKRHVKSGAAQCSDWRPLQTILGCDSLEMRLNPRFKYLCRNPKVNSGTNYPPFIYLFKDGMHWKFDNEFQPKKPFGNLIEGGVPAKMKWPGIHWPGATGADSKNFITIYKIKWSRWYPHDGQGDDADDSDKPSDDDPKGRDKKKSKPKDDSEDEDEERGPKGRLFPGSETKNGDNDDSDESKPKNALKNKNRIKDTKPDVNDISDKPILEEDGEPPDDKEWNAEDAGALIPVNIKEGKYMKIFDTNVCPLAFKDQPFDTAYWDGQCMPVSEDTNNFPPNIIAFIRTKNKMNYFIKKTGEHCVRPDASAQACNEWKDNKELFGCQTKHDSDVPKEQRWLCDNPVIKAGGVHNGIVYVFRGGKQWKFDNNPSDGKPFGDLIEGGFKAKNNWTGIHFPGGVGSWDDSFIMVFKNKWSKWKKESRGSSEGDLRDLPIGVIVEKSAAESPDSGALIHMGVDTKNRYAKIKGTDVCYLRINDKVANWDGKCTPVADDDNHFPPHIIAAVLTSDKIWYFINKDGQYCQREEDNKKECKEWKDNEDLFGCNDNKWKQSLIPLCKDTKVSAGGSVPPYIYIIKGKSYWIFDNKPKPNKPFGEIKLGNEPILTRFEGMHVPGGLSHNRLALVMVYANKWAQWRPNYVKDTSVIDISEQPIGDGSEKEEDVDDGDSGALIILDESRSLYAKIRGREVCHLYVKNEKCFWDGKCQPVEEESNRFPPFIVAAVKTREKKWFYFNAEGKHCERREGNTKPCTEWKDNSQAFGCKEDESRELGALCKDTAIKSGGNHWTLIYVFSKSGKYWLFDNKPKPNQPLGALIKGGRIANDKFPGIRIPGGASHLMTSFMMVYKNKWSLWKANKEDGDITDQPILDKSDDDSGNDANAGALINVDVENSKYAKIKGTDVCNLQIVHNMSTWVGSCRPVDTDNERFPPNIGAAIKARDRNWYYIRSNGKYCKREEGMRNECTEWEGNEQLFGCSGDDLKPELKSLCDNPVVDSGGNYPPHIYVFRGSKYWRFDGLLRKGRPFGNLVEGDKEAKESFDGILLPGGVSFNKNALVLVYNNSWSQWKPLNVESRLRKDMRQNDNEINNAPIGTVEVITDEANDVPDGSAADAGALIVVNEKKGRYAKIRGDRVCYYRITDEKCSPIEDCMKLSEDDNNYPPNIVAVIKDSDKNWYFFDDNGKYCKRPEGSRKECTQWKDSKEALGCYSNDFRLMSLCSNPQISFGTTFSPYVYVFRGGKYWKFNNREKENKPFGDCIEVGKPVKDKWPGMHFPGGAGYRKMSFIMVYKNQWSIWRGKGDKDRDNIIDAKISTESKDSEEEDKVVKSSVDAEDNGDGDYDMLRESPEDNEL